MPPYAIVLVFLTLVLPLGIVLTRLLGTNVAMLVVATSMVFFLSYEWLHLAYHLPPEHPIGRLGLIARLREHHRRHHEPRLMKRWNFNVTVPLFDWLHRTTWSPEREAARRASRQASRAPS
jgi:sterol desaturase/sphingolipid hydroxylase (fatty acid hydroxylase superfamily)